MSTDRELLELAALAAGMTLGAWRDDFGAFMYRDASPGCGYWNPLDDDGDALRLAVKLRLTIDHREHCVNVWDGCIGTGFIANESDPYAATRRAIVRAAAEIGKAMQARQQAGGA